jgi:hypothetical protein
MSLSPNARSAIDISNSSTRSANWQTAWVIASALCLVLLSTPGVRAVRASDDIASAAVGQTCDASASNDTVVTMEIALDRLSAAKHGPSDPANELSNGLNSTGFNYRSERTARSALQPHVAAD